MTNRRMKKMLKKEAKALEKRRKKQRNKDIRELLGLVFLGSLLNQ